MTWVCTADAWTCPHCATTWGRGMLTDPTWATTVVRLQLSHGASCGPRARAGENKAADTTRMP